MNSFKRLFLLFVLVLGLCIGGAKAQRFGTVPGRDNTFRQLTAGVVDYSFKAGVDSLFFGGGYYESHVGIAGGGRLLDSLAFAVRSNGNFRRGDCVIFSVRADGSSRKVKFVSGSLLAVASPSVVVLGANAQLTVVFRFIGGRWVEVSRVVV